VVQPSGQRETDTKTRMLDPADEMFVRGGIELFLKMALQA
jgi:hypothetical protein